MTLNQTYTTGGTGVTADQVIMGIDLPFGNLGDDPFSGQPDFSQEAGTTTPNETGPPNSSFEYISGGSPITGIPANWTEVSACPSRCTDQTDPLSGTALSMPFWFSDAGSDYFASTVPIRGYMDLFMCRTGCNTEGKSSNIPHDNTCYRLSLPAVIATGFRRIAMELYEDCKVVTAPVEPVWAEDSSVCESYIINNTVNGVIRTFYVVEVENDRVEWFMVSQLSLITTVVRTTITNPGLTASAHMTAISARHVGRTAGTNPVFPTHRSRCPNIEAWHYKWYREATLFGESNAPPEETAVFHE